MRSARKRHATLLAAGFMLIWQAAPTHAQGSDGRTAGDAPGTGSRGEVSVGAGTTSATTTGSSGTSARQPQAGQSGYEPSGGTDQEHARPRPENGGGFFQCDRIADETARARCHETARKAGPQSQSQSR